MPVSEAIDFVCSNFFDPTINHPDCDPKTRNVAKNYRVWATSITHTGSLADFLDFLEKSPDTTVSSKQTELGLKTISQVVKEFKEAFAGEIHDRLTPEKLVIGATYKTHTILSMCGVYDARSGGISPVTDENDIYEYVVIRATLSGGKYENRWLEEGNRLKYFLKSRQSVYKESYVENAAIIRNPQNPVIAFVRDRERDEFTYAGPFFLHSVHTEDDNSKWFDLIKWSDALGEIDSVDTIDSVLADQVEEAKKLNPDARQRRLASAPTYPEKLRATTVVFKRNPDVIAEVLYRAKGTCEGCEVVAPFARNSDGTPYLEVHHMVPLSVGGPDTVENAVALCPNCHRREHFGPAKWPNRSA